MPGEKFTGNDLSVLITGGRGLIGKYLTRLLLGRGYRVSHLSRRPGRSGNVRVFRWDPAAGYLDPEALEGIDFIVHLSGANIGAKWWFASRRNKILSSRVDSANLLFRSVSEKNHPLKAFISSSAVGYYGTLTSETILTEDDPPSDDFLGRLCRLWEEAALQFREKGIRTVCIRSAVVLEKNNIAIRRFMIPAKFGIVVRAGTGRQYFPWIHINDICNIYLKAMDDGNMSGAYNAVAPEQVNHDVFVRTMAKVMRRPVLLPPVPSWIIRGVFGGMSDIVLKGSRISCDKILKSGYSFRFPGLENALKDIISG